MDKKSKIILIFLFIAILLFLFVGYGFMDRVIFIQRSSFIIFVVVLALVLGYALALSMRDKAKHKKELEEIIHRLAEANAKLHQLDMVKSEFISIASHQLRTPLTAIKGFVSLIQEESYGKVGIKVKEAINKVYVANERLINLVEDLLNISRIELGSMQYQFAEVQVEDIIKELQDTFSLAAAEKDVKLEIKIPAVPLPKIQADGGKIREVISNLIDNSLKYTEKGTVTIEAEMKPGKNWMRIIVSDTGIGIPREVMPLLFSRFSRGENTSRLQPSGTGLGLYVGRVITEAHHGRIWAESEGEGKGSRFIIELPVKQN